MAKLSNSRTTLTCLLPASNSPSHLKAATLGRDHGFGRDVMNLVGLKAEHLSRHVKGADLPAPVGKELGNADHARQHLVDIARLFALGMNLRVAAEAHDQADRCPRIRQRGLGIRRTVEGRVVGGVGNGALRQHGWFLPEA